MKGYYFNYFNVKNVKRKKKEELQKKILKISGGLIKTLATMILADIYWTSEFMLHHYETKKASEAAIDAASTIEGIDWQKVKNTLYYLRKKGLIEYIKKEKYLKPEITKLGKQRLQALLPFYQKKRPWDGKIYLITYDIPEEKRNDREIFREYLLKKIGCGCLLRSVWLTPYNPRDVLKEFIEERKLSGLVIISNLGEDGSIGEGDIKDLIARIYKLRELNERYEEFIEEFGGKKKIDKEEIRFAYLSILADDPQLPRKLLPAEWLGDKAYGVYRKC